MARGFNIKIRQVDYYRPERLFRNEDRISAIERRSADRYSKNKSEISEPNAGETSASGGYFTGANK